MQPKSWKLFVLFAAYRTRTVSPMTPSQEMVPSSFAVTKPASTKQIFSVGSHLPCVPHSASVAHVCPHDTCLSTCTLQGRRATDDVRSVPLPGLSLPLS